MKSGIYLVNERESLAPVVREAAGSQNVICGESGWRQSCKEGAAAIGEG